VAVVFLGAPGPEIELSPDFWFSGTAWPGSCSVKENAMQAKQLDIRQMHRHELDLVLDWAAAEGWNPGLNDAGCFYTTDPGGFLIGTVDGKPVASIFAVKYGKTFAFIGGYIVRPAFRGLGYGIMLWNAAIAGLGVRNIGLDGVLAQQSNYAKSGFHLAHRNVRYEGEGSGRPVLGDDIVPLSSLSFDEVCRYDRAFFAEERVQFLQCWIDQPRHIAAGILDTQGPAGYAVLRPCRSGYKIGPLFADTPALAERLFVSLQGQVPLGAPVFLDVPEQNTAAVALATRHQLRACFETARMYTQGAPDLCMSRQYGITTFELG
jgi:ribosomal protein S18 acetylase RimI-like enzyme